MIPLRDAAPAVRRPIVTTGILLACVAVFAAELWVGATAGPTGLDDVFLALGVVPERLSSAVADRDVDVAVLATLVTYQFLHAGWLHLAGNMLYLWIFGNNVEDRLGRAGFLAFYLAGGVVAALAQVLIDPSSDIPLVGASGSISAVLGAYVVLFPRARVMSLVFLGFFFTLLEVPAVVLLGIWFGLQLLDGVLSLGAEGGGGGIAFFAHVGGFVAGFAFGLALRWVRPARAAAG